MEGTVTLPHDNICAVTGSSYHVWSCPVLSLILVGSVTKVYWAVNAILYPDISDKPGHNGRLQYSKNIKVFTLMRELQIQLIITLNSNKHSRAKTFVS